MYKSSGNLRQASLFWDLESVFDSKHPLYKLANLVDWDMFEKSFSPLYCHDNGRTSKPIRLMVGLLVLKHLRNVSDETVIAQFAENAYYQYFCGMESFTANIPCVPTELVGFRHRIGESGIEMILKESIRINLEIEDKRKEDEDKKNHKDNRGRKSDSEQTAFIDSTVQEKNVTIPTDSKLLNKVIKFCRKVAENERQKVRQSYARNEYDGHTIDKAMEQVRRIYGRAIKFIAGDRGYRGQDHCGDAKVLIPSVPKKSDSLYVRTKKHELFRKRAGIEPVIGHCKCDHRLSRNFYKGLLGDSINVMLAAAAFNFKRAMRVLLCLLERLASLEILNQNRLEKQSLFLANSRYAYA